LEVKGDASRQKLLNAQVATQGYRRLPRVLDAAREQGADEEVRALLQEGIDGSSTRSSLMARPRVNQ